MSVFRTGTEIIPHGLQTLCHFMRYLVIAENDTRRQTLNPFTWKSTKLPHPRHYWQSDFKSINNSKFYNEMWKQCKLTNRFWLTLDHVSAFKLFPPLYSFWAQEISLSDVIFGNWTSDSWSAVRKYSGCHVSSDFDDVCINCLHAYSMHQKTPRYQPITKICWSIPPNPKSIHRTLNSRFIIQIRSQSSFRR